MSSKDLIRHNVTGCQQVPGVQFTADSIYFKELLTDDGEFSVQIY